jgi:hypothetical protein
MRALAFSDDRERSARRECARHKVVAVAIVAGDREERLASREAAAVD